MSSFLDKTDGTVAPLYDQIDDLQSQIAAYQSLLAAANDEVDDKLAKLTRAGTGAVQLSKELEAAQLTIRRLEQEALAEDGDRGAQRLVNELREVKDELVRERAQLLRELADIKAVSPTRRGRSRADSGLVQHCHQISGQLSASRSAQASTEREAYALRHALGSGGGGAHQQEDFIRELGVLRADLAKVQGEALDLGEEIRLARRLAPAASGGSSKEEAKGLLMMIKYLKAKFTRESYLRADLAHQKLYLQLLLAQKQRM